MKFSLTNTGSIVIIGYCLLVILAMTGIVTIYMELIKSHRQSQDNSVLKKELIDLSNALTTMYQAEGTAGLLAFTDNEKLKIEYDSLTYRIFDQIDSLRSISTDLNIVLGLDSLIALLSKKYDNALEMFRLTRLIDRNVVKEISEKSIITRDNIDKLNDLLANVTKIEVDTVQVIAKKRNFFRRVRDVVKTNKDTITQISKSYVSEKEELAIPLMSDTIVEFIHGINKDMQRKNAKIIQQLIVRQRELYTIKELTTLQIGKIVDAMKEKEYQANLEFLKEKNESLKRSSSTVAIVGLSALIVAIFFMSWTLHSLSKAQQLQKNIQEAKKQTDKLLLSSEQLIYTITHDIKAPLSSIIGFLDLLTSEAAHSRKQQYYVDNMYSSALHIQDLVRNLLDFHSIEKEQPQLKSIVFSPDALIHSIYESFLPLVQKKKQVFVLKSTFPENGTFLSDPYFIRQIVNNLLSNAIKFTPEKGRILLITSSEEQNRWKISVQDNGPGIDPADHAKIFEEFVRLGKHKNEEGTGLGLTISQKLAALLGGTIDVASKKGAGSVFTLTIPLIPVVKKAGFQLNKGSDIVSVRILFADDDPVQLRLLSELMKREDWFCAYCSSAYETLELLEKASFDIIFTDIHFPDMDGFELVRQIRESNFSQAASVPIIAFSADCQKSETELKEAGFTDSLLKPFKVRQLLEIIEKYTSAKRKPDKTYPEESEFGWESIMDFVVDDKEAARKIIDSFIEETNKDKESLKIAFQKNDTEAVQKTAHKMLTLMRMISAKEIVSILTDFEKGNISEEQKYNLFRLLDETLREAETVRRIA